ncbi:MAG: hypothetical protein GY820_17760 [Gammaproteobacteria bacterium]|nr:hypothetical protein [Gammaproteobacteria bacterium]
MTIMRVVELNDSLSRPDVNMEKAPLRHAAESLLWRNPRLDTKWLNPSA